MTKKERILQLYKTGKYTTRQIADIVDCDIAYVRVAARQRKERGRSEIDQRYMESGGNDRRKARFKERYHSDPEFRRRHIAEASAWHRDNRKRKAEARAS